MTTWRPTLEASAATGPPGPVRLRGLVSGAAVVAAATVLVGVLDPNQPGHYPLCPFRALTGLACPGCGGLRAVHALTRGHLAEAFGHNPLIVLLLPGVVLAWVLAVRRALLGRVPAWRPTSVQLVLAAGVVLAFTVLRNVPGIDVLGP